MYLGYEHIFLFALRNFYNLGTDFIFIHGCVCILVASECHYMSGGDRASWGGVEEHNIPRVPEKNTNWDSFPMNSTKSLLLLFLLVMTLS